MVIPSVGELQRKLFALARPAAGDVMTTREASWHAELVHRCGAAICMRQRGWSGRASTRHCAAAPAAPLPDVVFLRRSDLATLQSFRPMTTTTRVAPRRRRERPTATVPPASRAYMGAAFQVRIQPREFDDLPDVASSNSCGGRTPQSSHRPVNEPGGDVDTDNACGARSAGHSSKRALRFAQPSRARR